MIIIVYKEQRISFIMVVDLHFTIYDLNKLKNVRIDIHITINNVRFFSFAQV